MKKFLLLLAVAATAFISCDEKDDIDNGGGDNTVKLEVIKSNEEAISIANGVYGPLQTLSSSFSFLLESTSESTISFEGEESADGPLASRLETDPNNWYVIKHFSRLYNSIAAANTTLEKLDSSTVSTSLTQDGINLAAGRVKFTRALSYLYLVQLFGEVPLVLSTKPDATAATRVSIDKVYEQIVTDLTEAEALLPDNDANRSNPTKGAANAILARAYLAWGQHPLSQAEVASIANSKTDPPHQTDQAKLQKAVEYADKVINSGNYQLLSDFNKNFGATNENAVEHIFTIDHVGDNIDAQGNHQTHCPFTFAFDLTKDNHIGPADVTLLNRFDDEDRRKQYSITDRLINNEDNQEYLFDFPVTSPRYAKYIHRLSDGSNVVYNFDGTYDGSYPGHGQPNNINRIEIRYAEVLLTKAEALFFLGQPTQALPIINEIRTRAFGNTDHNLTTLTKEDIFNEWDLELNFEQKRWTNLVRWKTLIQTTLSVQDFEYFKDIYATEESILAEFGNEVDGKIVNAPFFAKIHKHLHAKYNNISGKFYRFPIPTGESGDNLGITPQNPGY